MGRGSELGQITRVVFEAIRGTREVSSSFEWWNEDQSYD